MLKNKTFSPISKFKRGRNFMMIDKIKSISQTTVTNKVNSPKSQDYSLNQDSIRISKEAIEKTSELQLEADIKAITYKTLSLPDEANRNERLQEIKQKLAMGFYDNPTPEMLSATADQLLVHFFYPNS